jgi:uncharacterized protein
MKILPIQLLPLPIATIVGCLVLSVSVQAASFGCAKVSTQVESMVCDDADLSKLDDDLANAYKKEIDSSEDINIAVKSQKLWLKETRDNCQDVGCLKAAYQSRVKELLTAISLTKQSYDTVHLEEDPPNSFAIRCDKHNQRLIVADERFLPPINRNFQREVVEVGTNEGALIKGGGSDERPLMLSTGSERHECRIGRVSYQIEIEPYIFNANPMGECGAEPPVISLTVKRNGKAIISKLNFGMCGSDGSINRVQFSEATGLISVLTTIGSYSLPLRVERQFKIATPPEDWMTATYGNLLPSGDADTDLFLAVYRRDIADIRTALQHGANPNATDLFGFPPLSYLGEGREDAYRSQNIENFNKQSESIAQILFAAGAVGDFLNINGVSLLDYLLYEGVPDTVIEGLLEKGADVKSGYPLFAAAHGARLNLMKKFIEKGAEPNKETQDGSTAIWAAASHGLGVYRDWTQPPISEYKKCIQLLLQHGAKVKGMKRDVGGIPRLLVYYSGKDERVKTILAEILPYASHDEIVKAQQLAEENSYPISQWLEEQLH